MKNNKKSRRYLNDFFLLAVVFFISFIIWIIIQFNSGSGNRVVITYSPLNGEKQTSYLDTDSEDYYVITISSDETDLPYIQISDPYGDIGEIPENVLNLCRLDGLNTEKESDKYINILFVKDGSVNMVFANCPDKVCVKTNSISKTGQSIICLPHRLVVSIENSGNNNGKEEPDAVTW